MPRPRKKPGARRRNARTHATAIHHLPRDIASKARRIHKATLETSANIREADFTAISGVDLEHMFAQYDTLFFDGLLRSALNRQADQKLFFRVSKRMTRAAGKTTHIKPRPGRLKGNASATTYEIAISAPLLFQNFKDTDREVTVNGIACADRLEALQRVFEHELIHLLELLLWERSSCSRSNFKFLAQNIFGHTDVTHQLITQSERAFEKFGVVAGDRVAFRVDGIRYEGIVNRITKRATVLVEQSRGRRYSDGRRYSKFYVPLPMLEKLSGSRTRRRR